MHSLVWFLLNYQQPDGTNSRTPDLPAKSLFLFVRNFG